ncbi:MAG: site-specific integrase [Firmicutes bacterium]|nr:site-specific integrase [Bacillota bacterium]
MAKGENIYKRKDGRWEARYKKGTDENGKIHYGYCYAKSYKEVKEKKIKAQLQLLENPSFSSFDTKQTFQSFGEKWLTQQRHHLKDSSYSKYHTILNKHLYPSIGHYPLYQIDSEVISQTLSQLVLEKELSSKTVKDILTLFHSIWKNAQVHSKGKLPNILVPSPKEQKKKIRILTVKEEKVFLKQVLTEMDSCKLGIYVAYQCGLRIGEICALRWENVNTKEAYIRIDSSLQRVKVFNQIQKTRVRLDVPKTENSVRIIPVSKNLNNLLKKYQKNNPNTFVLTGNEKHMEPRQLQKKFKNLVESCQLSNIHFHTLRHTFATRCVECGMDIKTLSEILGHSTIQVTLNRYVHPDLDLKRKNMEKLWNMSSVK